jgi:hypothetical protein
MLHAAHELGRSVRNCLDGIEALRPHDLRFLAVSQKFHLAFSRGCWARCLALRSTLGDAEVWRSCETPSETRLPKSCAIVV